LATAHLDNQRWKRNLDTRWDERRLEALLDFAAAVKKETRLSLRIASSTRPNIRTDPLDPEIGKPLLEAAEDERAALFEAVIIIADRAILESARAWMYAVWELREHSGPPRPDAPDSFDDTFKRASERRNIFYRTVREIFARGDRDPLAPTSTY
jgi:hypothetical protein